jgi:hypothetical protein
MGIEVAMKTLALTLAVAITSLASVSAQAAQIAQFNMSGTDNIFAAGLSSIPNDSANGGQGNLPDELTITGSEQLYVTATGLVNCCDGGSTPPSTAAGFATNPFGGVGSNITNSLAAYGSTVPNFSSSVSFPLLYTFTNSSGQDVGGLNALTWGTAGYITAPSTADHIYFGFADGYGFNGLAGAYGDNFNSANAPGILLTVSSAPEPSTWALLILGVAMTGGALRMARRQRLVMATA